MSIQITDYFDVNQGVSVLSSGGIRRFTEALDSYSQLYTSLITSNNATKHSVDSCWESGNIYCINDSGCVKKITFDGTVLASLQLSNPVAVSVRQYSSIMQENITYPPQDDKGCWIADNGTGKIIKTDKDLNILKEYSGVSGAFCLEATGDGGCFVAERRLVGGSYLGSVFKLDTDMNLIATKDFTEFTTTIQNIDRVVVDVNNKLWVLGDDILFNLSISSSNTIVEWFAIDILGANDPFSSSSSDEEMHVGDIDVDKSSGNNQYIYVTGGNSSKAFVLKYNQSGINKGEMVYYNIGFPYVVQVVQGIESSSLYLLSDPYKWDQYGYGSSSSSELYSSSSSSSSELYSLSSSSSSSSSGICCNSYSVVSLGHPQTNGTYNLAGYYNGKPYWQQTTGLPHYIYWDDFFGGANHWCLYYEFTGATYGTQAVPSDCPDGVWSGGSVATITCVENSSSSSSSSS